MSRQILRLWNTQLNRRWARSDPAAASCLTLEVFHASIHGKSLSCPWLVPTVVVPLSRAIVIKKNRGAMSDGIPVRPWRKRIGTAEASPSIFRGPSIDSPASFSDGPLVLKNLERAWPLFSQHCTRVSHPVRSSASISNLSQSCTPAAARGLLRRLKNCQKGRLDRQRYRE